MTPRPYTLGLKIAAVVVAARLLQVAIGLLAGATPGGPDPGPPPACVETGTCDWERTVEREPRP